MPTTLPHLDARALSRALDSMLEDLEVATWCRRRLAASQGLERQVLTLTQARRCAQAARALAVIARLDPSFSRELEATVVADAVPISLAGRGRG